jgi:putative intracellular protease/amidase
MRNILVLAVCLSIFLTGCSTVNTVLIIPREGSYGDLDFMLEHEVNVMVRVLQEAGYNTEIASLSGKSFVGEQHTVLVDLSLAEVKPKNYKGILLACMAVGTPGPVPPEAVLVVKNAHARNIPVAAQYGAVFILAEAGLLDGRKYAFGGPMMIEGVYSGTGVVVDGLVATSGTCPYQAKSSRRKDGTTELTQALISMIQD